MNPTEFMEYFANHPLDMAQVLNIVDRNYVYYWSVIKKPYRSSRSDLEDFLFPRQGQYPVVVLSQPHFEGPQEPEFLAYSQPGNIQSLIERAMEYGVDSAVSRNDLVLRAKNHLSKRTSVIHPYLDWANPYRTHYHMVADEDFKHGWDGWNNISQPDMMVDGELIPCLQIEFKRVILEDLDGGEMTLREFFQDESASTSLWGEGPYSWNFRRDTCVVVLQYYGPLDPPALNYPPRYERNL